jgi:hypothetical protein
MVHLPVKHDLFGGNYGIRYYLCQTLAAWA